jgi:hypothetical protein
MRTSSNIISVCLIGSGLAAWGLTARPLVENPKLDVPLNPLGINRSPYGEVFAMAMQSPINSYFHAGMGEKHSHAPGEACTDECTTSKEKPKEEEEHVHDEHCDHGHDHDHHSADEEKDISIHDKLLGLIQSMNEVSELRTNPKPANEALMLHHRRVAEDKLRFAYEMDPAHYGNYNSLHFFLTEPQIGTRPQITPAVMKLAKDTIDYCLEQENDPRPALTAAAACTNILDLMFLDHNNNKFSTFTLEQMRQGLILLDHCLNRYHTIAKQWDESKNWELLSPMRITECQTRLHFILKIRETAAVTIARLESEAKAAQ